MDQQTHIPESQAGQENPAKQTDFSILIDEMKVRGFSRQTIKAYCYHNQRFLQFIRKSPRDITKKHVEQYLVRLYDRNVPSATRHLITASLKFYYEQLLKRRFQLRYPKKENKLSTVLTKDEILRMIDSLQNPKHKLLLMLMYGSGLRLGEVISVRIEDFDAQRGTLHVRRGKGAKDRMVNLSATFLRLFRDCVKDRQEGFLFCPWDNTKKHISGRTVQKILTNSLKKTGIKKKAHPHTLRTSYATHLIEQGTDISYVQRLLGHKDIKTTQTYLRLSRSSIASIRSPLD